MTKTKTQSERVKRNFSVLIFIYELLLLMIIASFIATSSKDEVPTTTTSLKAVEARSITILLTATYKAPH